MSSADTARVALQSARAELIERIRSRDQVLLIYLGATGALLGIGLPTTGNTEVLLALPFLALGAAILVSQHNAVIGSLGAYCVLEVGRFLQRESEWAPQWDDSRALREYRRRATGLRTWGHTIIVLIPTLAALGLNWEHALRSAFPLGVVWWFGALCFAASGWVILAAHSMRAELYAQYTWHSAIEVEKVTIRSSPSANPSTAPDG